MATLIKIDRNGSKHYEGLVPCDRCGGRGFWEGWRATGKTCWKCGGSGKVFSKWIERTPEYEAKLAEKRKERQAKAQAEEDAKNEATRAQRELAEKLEREERERQARLEEARKAVSRWVGEEGERIEVKGTYDHSAWYTVHDMFGREEIRYVHKFKDTGGNVFIWRTGKGLPEAMGRGEPVNLKGTVKTHYEREGEKQTVLLRVIFNK